MTLHSEDEGPPAKRLSQLLLDLCAQQLSVAPDDDYEGYLREHVQPGWIEDHVRTFRWYWPLLEGSRNVLDWGCRHGPDSVLIRACSDDIELHGCDTARPDQYRVLRDFSRMHYRQLATPVVIPYDDRSFDAVVAAGVLEHVPSDWQSLAELYRILRPGGRLIVTYLPNTMSVIERRHRLKREATVGHDRLYSRRGMQRALLHTGFRPVTGILYQTFAWQRQARAVFGDGVGARRAAAVLRTALPVHVVRSGTLCFVAERCESMR